jgi:hypothetical protein
VEALRIGIGEVVALRREVRLAPVELSPSQEVRLRRLTGGRAVVNVSESVVFVPAPEGDPAVALLEFLRTMWPPEPDES